MKVFYRISDASSKKERFPHATKQHCLDNFLQHFHKDEVVIYADNVCDDTYKWIVQVGCETHRSLGGSSSGGFRVVFDEALKLPDEEIVYFVEDDYLHLLGSRKVLLEGLEKVDYVSLYDHRDKYIPYFMGGNNYIDAIGSEVTHVFMTHSSHWKFTNSTTMTFASRVHVLKEDELIWRWCTTGEFPYDCAGFLKLREKGRILATPIPGYSTHCEPAWASPLVDWTKV